MRGSRRVLAASIAAGLLASADASAQTFNGTISQVDPTMPVVGISEPDCGPQLVPPVHYEVRGFTPTISAPYTFSLISTGARAAFYLYRTAFDPGSGTVNCIAAASSGDPKRFTEPLTAGTSYFIVIFNNDSDQTLTINYSVRVSPPRGKVLDFDNDGFSDFAVGRTEGPFPPPRQWWISDNATGAITHRIWGIAPMDIERPADYDGDGRTDVAVWRSGPIGTAGFWILRSSDGGVTFEPFGQADDFTHVIGDFDGDRKADLGVFREGLSPGDASVWYYKRSSDGVIVGTVWGQHGDYPFSGDFDGDGRADFGVLRPDNILPVPSGGNTVWLKQTTAGVTAFRFGIHGDLPAPGDFDGDGKIDVAIIRLFGAATHYTWWVKRSSDGGLVSQTFGPISQHLSCQADYDGDGKTDVAVYQYGGAYGVFWISKSSGGLMTRIWGVPGDYPTAARTLR